MLRRFLADRILTALSDTPVVVLHGARQSGKTTLVRWLAEHGHRAKYETLDDILTLAAAAADPVTFLADRSGPLIIDEVQLAPGLYRAIKHEVDRNRTPGRYLLTGSANVLMLPELAQALVGRVEILTLCPLSVGELLGAREAFVTRVFDADGPRRLADAPRRAINLWEHIVIGGYPEVVGRPEAARRAAWFGAHLSTVVQRDVRQMADIQGIADLPRLLALLAAQSAGLLNVTELSRDIGFAQPTIKRYLTLLAATHVYQPLPAWATNARKRLIKGQKVFLNDTGLTAHLLNLGDARQASESPYAGRILEAFIHQELRRQISFAEDPPLLLYYRTTDGSEVDFVLEQRGGRVVGIEVKATATPDSGDFQGLRDLAETAGSRFHAGILLHGGEAAVPFGDRIWALPIAALWSPDFEARGGIKAK